MTSQPSVHAIIYAWPRVQARAFAIAEAIGDVAQRTSIVLCTDEAVVTAPDVDLHVLDNACYFGRQFQKTIEIFEGDVLLQIAADAEADDWPQVARQCRARFAAEPRLGVWAPDVDWTHWSNDRVELFRSGDPDLIVVAQTDCIVWAMRRDVVDFMKTLDYGLTPLGWGIDWAAIAWAYAQGLRVFRDLTVKLRHPRGSGYDHRGAQVQMERFLASLGGDEQVQLALLRRAVRRDVGRASRGLLKKITARLGRGAGENAQDR